MIDSRPKKTIAFAERDEEFVKQLATNIGCHYAKANNRTYNLNKNKAGDSGEQGVFAWVHKEGDRFFWVTTRKTWVEEAKARILAGRKKENVSYFPRDVQRAEDSVCFNTKLEYLNTVKVLKLIFKAV
jgi:hypothetical protein